MSKDHTIQAFTKGTQNLLSPEIIANDAAQSSLGWLTKDGKLVLSYGRKVTGNDTATSGKIYGVHFGYKVDGSKVMYRKMGTKIQYLKPSNNTWTDIITGLTETADYSFTNYSSLAGAFTFVGGVDGIWKIINANPESPFSVYSASKNFKGKILIDRGRMLLWGRTDDRTGIYGSWIDNQRAVASSTGVYTAVTGEATAAATSGTLAFKASGATRSCFAVTITITASGEVFTDNYLGVLTGSLGGTGTINYATGAWTLSTSSAGTAAYQWEDPTLRGVADFSKTATRLAGEGFQFPQDIGGDSILNVLIGQDGAYYSIKSQSIYRLMLEATDLTADNNVYRTDIGVPSYRAGVSTNKGIVLMNTANPSKPEMTILQRNPIGDNIEPVILFPHFKFANYDYTDCAFDTWERYIIVMCRNLGSTSNDALLLCDPVAGTVDAVQYSGRCSAKDGGNFYVGHPLVGNVYELFDGFDDDGIAITNYWIGNAERYNERVIAERLKKFRKLKLKGTITMAQQIAVYIDYDGSGFQLVGTIRGDGDYVDYGNPQSIGSNLIGQSQIGGDDLFVTGYNFFTELKIKSPKFRTRTIKFVALGIGYVDIQYVSDWDIMTYDNRIPGRFRQKSNTSLDGITHDIPEV